MTGRKIFHLCRRAGVLLSVKGDALVFDAPAGALSPDLRSLLKSHKSELLAMLVGDYLRAALDLVIAQPEPDRAGLVESFDERAGIVEFDGNRKRGEGERTAYIELARRVEGGGA